MCATTEPPRGDKGLPNARGFAENGSLIMNIDSDRSRFSPPADESPRGNVALGSNGRFGFNNRPRLAVIIVCRSIVIVKGGGARNAE